MLAIVSQLPLIVHYQLPFLAQLDLIDRLHDFARLCSGG